jgi:hypothetical protein
VQGAVQDSDVREHARDHVRDIAHRLADADVADQAREKLDQVARKGADLAHSVMNTAAGSSTDEP